MAVPEQTPYIEHTGNGITTSFALGFQCETKDHLIVLVDDVEPPIATWSLTGGNVEFTTAPAVGKKITIQRNTPFSRTTDYQSYNNSFRPPAVNKDFDWIWLKLQELGVADWILGARIDALKNYVDRKDDELKAYLMEEIRKQGVALDQLDEYYNYLMQRLAQIAVDKGWDASFVVDGDKTQKQINTKQSKINNAIGFLAEIKESNTWQQNRDVIQVLNDQIYAEYGGGVIQLPPGEYLLKGVMLDSGIKVNLNQGTLIRHPDNYDVNIFETKRYQTSGSASKGSFTFTVADASKFQLGAIVAIRAAGGYNYVNNTLLVNSISATDTANLQLVNTSGFLSVGTLTIDDEIISYTSMTSGGLLGGVVRGALGSTAAAHSNTSPIGISMRHVSEIINISGNEITILDAVKTTVSNVNVMCGGIGCEVVGGKFIGEQQLDVLGVRWNPVQFNMHRFGYLKYFAENCESAFFLNVSSDNTIEVDGKDLGKANLEAGVTVGAGGWLFTQCHRNRIYSKFIGNCWAGIYLDNRTSAGTEWDGPCNDNSGVLHCKYNNYKSSLTTSGFLVIGGNDNIFDVFCEGVHTGATTKSEDQMYTHDGVYPSCTGNQINVRFKKGYRSIVCQKSAVGNVFTNRQEGIAASPIIEDGNIVLSTNDGGGIGNYLRFNNGTYLRPGISFKADPSFGFTYAADRIRLNKSGVELLNFSDLGLNLADGQNITSGTAAGLKVLTSPNMKLGFHGVTPVVQQTAATVATDAASTQTLANDLRLALINLGILKA